MQVKSAQFKGSTHTPKETLSSGVMSVQSRQMNCSACFGPELLAHLFFHWFVILQDEILLCQYMIDIQSISC